MPSSRPLVRLPVPPGPDGPQRLLPALVAALNGSGPAIAPTPVVGPMTSAAYVGALLAATRPDDPDLALESDDVAVVLATSGSTGNPRGVLLAAACLTALTDVVNGDGARPQWVVALPVTSIGGLNVLLRSLPTGREPIVLPSIGGAGPFTPAAFHAAVDSAGCDDVRASLVPAQLARLLDDDAGVAALRACRQVLVGGAALRPSLRAAAAEAGVGVTSTYGGTETSGGCVYDGVPLPGVTVAVQDDVLVVKGPNVALGYRGEPRLTAERFTANGFVTSDVGTVDDNGTVTVVGRADDVVIINGVNVSPTAVEAVVVDVAGIRTAAVVVRDQGTGPHLWAFVEADDSEVGDRVRAAVTEQLGSPARPQEVRRVQRLPHLPNGKVDRMLLLDWAAADEGAR